VQQNIDIFSTDALLFPVAELCSGEYVILSPLCDAFLQPRTTQLSNRCRHHLTQDSSL